MMWLKSVTFTSQYTWRLLIQEKKGTVASNKIQYLNWCDQNG